MSIEPSQQAPSPDGCSRRAALRSFVAGTLLMPGIAHELLAADSGSDAANGDADPLAPKAPHFPAKAKRVIFLFMTGGVSHVDSFDPKPRLFADVGKEVKLDHPEIRNRPGYERIFLKRPQWEFRPRGQCGMETSDLFPQLAECVDDIALIRSMHTSHSNHYNATLGMHTGSFAFARPSIGAWVSYGLGSENRNMPSFITIAPLRLTPARRSTPATSCRAPTRGRWSCRAPSRWPTSLRE